MAARQKILIVDKTMKNIVYLTKEFYEYKDRARRRGSAASVSGFFLQI